MPNYKKISKNIQRLTISNPRTANQIDWLNVNSAGKTEIEYLRKKFNFGLPHLMAASANANSQRPMLSRTDSYVFMILHFPVLDPISGRITPAEIDFFIGHGFLVTMPGKPFGALNDFFNLGKKDGNSLLAYEFESSAILLYEILKKMMDYSYAILDENSLAITQAEKIILDENQKKSAGLILNLRHNLINLRKIMQNHKNIMKSVMAMESSIISAEYLKKYYGELIEQTKTFWETMENQREMVETLYDSYQSLANHRLNNSMKMLTIFYVTFSSLSLIAAIFSVKVDDGMPFLNNPNGFWIILSIMSVAGLALVLLFKKKNWL